MKTVRLLLFPSLFLAALTFVLSGCYTQLATYRDHDSYDRYSRDDDQMVNESDSLEADDDYYGDDEYYDDGYYDAYDVRARVGFSYYYPRHYGVYGAWGYDPWYNTWSDQWYPGYYNYYNWYSYYDPWICGTPFVGRPYWYNRYWAGYYGGYYYTPYYSYPHGYVLAGGSGMTRTRDSGYRRSGDSRTDYGYGRSFGTSGSGYSVPPAGRTSSDGDGSYPSSRVGSSSSTGSTRSTGGVRSTGRSSEPPSRGTYSPPSRSSGGSSTRSSGSSRSSGGSRSSGSSRGRDRLISLPDVGTSSAPSPASSYSPPRSVSPTPPMPMPSATPTPSNSGSSNRSSGATRGR